MLHEEEEKEKREADHRVPPHQVNFSSVKKHPQHLSVNFLTSEFINPQNLAAFVLQCTKLPFDHITTKLKPHILCLLHRCPFHLFIQPLFSL